MNKKPPNLTRLAALSREINQGTENDLYRKVDIVKSLRVNFICDDFILLITLFFKLVLVTFSFSLRAVLPLTLFRRKIPLKEKKM